MYVEGMTELVFVYHTIMAYYQKDWTTFHMEFVSANPSDQIRLPREYGAEDADNQFLIYNCGSDGSVIPVMIERFQSHLLQGFTRIVGLQDVYGARYFDVYKARHNQIEWPKVNSMIADLEETVAKLDATGTMKIHFSIMEIEAWILAMPELLAEAFPGIPLDPIADNDPESCYVHPYRVLSSIVPYAKDFSSVEGLFSRIDKTHIDNLLLSGKCASFGKFYTCLFDS